MDNKKNFLDKLTRNQLLFLGIVSLLISILCIFLGFYFFYTNSLNWDGVKLLFVFILLGFCFFFSCFQKLNSLSKDQSEDKEDLGSKVKQSAMETIKTFWKKLARSQILCLGIAALCVSILGAILILKFLWNSDGFQYSLTLLIAGIGFFYFCFRKYKSFSIDQSKDNTDEITDYNNDKPYILYLRNSNDDSQTDALINSSGMYYTEEEILVGSLKKLGTMLAVDKSGKSSPKLGAKRVYVSDDQWQDKVQDLSADARLVIIHLDEAEGLNQDWEFCLNTIDDLGKLLFIVPSSMTTEEESVNQLVAAIKNQRDEIQSESINVSQPLNIGTIGLFLYFEKNEDGTYIVKQTQGIGNWDPLKMYGAFLWKSFRNIRPETREFHLMLQGEGFLGDNPFNKLKLSLEPVFKRFNLSSFNEKLAYWSFRFVQVAEYFFVIGILFFAVAIICILLGVKF